MRRREHEPWQLLFCEAHLLETVLGLSLSDDAEVRHDALAVLLLLSQTQPRARALLAEQTTLELLARLAASHFSYARHMQLGLTLQLLDTLLLGPTATSGQEAAAAALREHAEQAHRGPSGAARSALLVLLQPLLLKILLQWGVDTKPGVRWWSEAYGAAERLLSWTAAVQT